MHTILTTIHTFYNQQYMFNGSFVVVQNCFLTTLINWRNLREILTTNFGKVSVGDAEHMPQLQASAASHISQNLWATAKGQEST